MDDRFNFVRNDWELAMKVSNIELLWGLTTEANTTQAYQLCCLVKAMGYEMAERALDQNPFSEPQLRMLWQVGSDAWWNHYYERCPKEKIDWIKEGL